MQHAVPQWEHACLRVGDHPLGAERRCWEHLRCAPWDLHLAASLPGAPQAAQHQKEVSWQGYMSFCCCDWALLLWWAGGDLAAGSQSGDNFVAGGTGNGCCVGAGAISGTLCQQSLTGCSTADAGSCHRLLLWPPCNSGLR